MEEFTQVTEQEGPSSSSTFMSAEDEAPAPGHLPQAPAPGHLPQAPAPGHLPQAPAPGHLPQAPAPGHLPQAPAPGHLPQAPAPDDGQPVKVQSQQDIETGGPDSTEDDFVVIKVPRKVFLLLVGATLGSERQLLEHIPAAANITVVTSMRDCDLVLAFCPIVSRAGTDVHTALELYERRREEEGLSDTEKRVILVVLHHTFNPDYTVPDISRHVTRGYVTHVVNCLFHESAGGLLSCPHNDTELTKLSAEFDTEVDRLDLEIKRLVHNWISYFWEKLYYLLSLIWNSEALPAVQTGQDDDTPADPCMDV